MLGRVLKNSLNKGKMFKNINKIAAMNFRSTPALSKKLDIGEAAVVLEQKISGISQVVSRYKSIMKIYLIPNHN